LPNPKNILFNLVHNNEDFQYYYGGNGNFSQNNINDYSDRRGGRSDEPYVKGLNAKDVLKKDNPLSLLRLTDTITGGFIDGGVGTQLYSRGQDVIRIGKYLLDTPEGPFWLLKQKQLQNMNPQLEWGNYDKLGEETDYKKIGSISSEKWWKPKSKVGKFLADNTKNILNKGINVLNNEISKINNNGKSSNRIFNNGINLMASIAGSGGLLNITRHGLTPNDSEKFKYSNVVKSLDEKGLNRLSSYLLPKLSGIDKIELNGIFFSYSGGPDSTLGLGDTIVKRYYDTTDGLFKSQNLNTFMDGTLITTNVSKLDENNKYLNSDYKKFIGGFERIRIGNPGSSNKSIKSDYNKTLNYNWHPTEYSSINTNESKLGFDKINVFPIVHGNSEGGIASKGTLGNKNNGYTLKTNFPVNINLYNIIKDGKESITKYTQDLIKFRFEAIDNEDPTKSDFIIFRALISDFKDNHKAEWNNHTYNGRGEDLYTYQKYTRSISFNFKVVCFSEVEMKPIYQKLNYLISNLSPDYSNSKKMRGPLMKLTIGNYLVYQPGFITSLDISIPNESPWEINLGEPEGTSNSDYSKELFELPHYLDCSLSFTPIHNFLPKKGITTPFIGVGINKKSNSNGYESLNSLFDGLEGEKDKDITDIFNEKLLKEINRVDSSTPVNTINSSRGVFNNTLKGNTLSNFITGSLPSASSVDYNNDQLNHLGIDSTLLFNPKLKT